jgi:hypothetical protein
MAWYNLQSENKNTSKKEYLQVCRHKEFISAKIRELEAVLTGGIKTGYQYRLVTEKNFSALVALDFFLKTYDVAQVDLAIYRMNYPAVLRIREICESGMPMNIIVSSFFRENKKYEKWTRELELFAAAKENVSLAFAWSHAKVMLCKTRCGKHLVFEGSGNLSDNARIEQYLIEDCAEMYDFHKKWMDEIHRGAKGDDC